jgi:hypothetical protein
MPLTTLLPLKLPPTILMTLQTQKPRELASHTHTPKKEKKKRNAPDIINAKLLLPSRHDSEHRLRYECCKDLL